MDQQVCHVIGQDGDHLYGIACNNRAYMRKKGPNGAWYGIEKQVWENAKTNAGPSINSSLVKIEDSYAHKQDPEDVKVIGTGTKWGATANGVYVKSGAGPWKLRAQWKCCGN